MSVVAWIFTTYGSIHQYRGLIQCTLDDSADKTNVYRWKIYMYLPHKFGRREKTGSKRRLPNGLHNYRFFLLKRFMVILCWIPLYFIYYGLVNSVRVGMLSKHL